MADRPIPVKIRAQVICEPLPLDGRCTLGEGLFLNADLITWVDIDKNRLYVSEKSRNRSIDLPVKATVILSCKDQELLLASGSGLGFVSLSSGEYRETVSFTEFMDSAIYRTNDGCMLSDGRYLIGIMHQSAPESNPGAVFLVDSDGAVSLAFDEIYIPNSFVELSNGDVLISDSQTQTIYRCKIGKLYKNSSREPWFQTSSRIAPDGGCRLTDGYIAIAMWDGACIMVFEESGKAIAEIAVPAKRPTNVKYRAHEASMWVTSASEGLTESEMDAYPLSGNTFCIKNPLAALCN